MPNIIWKCPYCNDGDIVIESESGFHMSMSGKHNSHKHYGRNSVFYLISEKCDKCGKTGKELKRKFVDKGAFTRNELKCNV